MKKIILINPDYYDTIFSKSKVRAAISRGTMTLGLAALAATLTEHGHEVKILDLNINNNPQESLNKEVREFNPDFIGITATTPLIKQVYKITATIKNINGRIMVIVGGPHSSALPEDVLKESTIDCVVKGEGDFAITKIVEQGLSASIPNIYFKKNEQIIKSEIQNSFIENLDNLPYPAYELFDIKSYAQPRISSKKAPLGYLETSRGCCYRCVFCNKNIHGYKVRMKSPKRVVDEMERMLKIGFREIHVIDDLFTADMSRSFLICEEIIKRRLKFPWYPRGGIRVDRINFELLKIMKKAGCYRIPFGIESGSQRVLDVINKKISLEQCENAVALAKKAGLVTECYFMLGLPSETEEEIKKTIDFAIKLDPDYVKFAITLPLPGTSMYEEMLGKNQIKTKDWEKYTFSTSPRELYDHDVLSWQILKKYSKICYIKFYFRVNYIFKMIYKTAVNGSIFGHISAFLRTRW